MEARTVPVEWRGTTVQATVPATLAGWTASLTPATARRTERAAAAAVRTADRATGGLETAARLLLRTEGLASSEIEGLRAPAVDVAIAQATDEPAGAGGGVAAWVADNLAVVTDALAEAGPLDHATLHGWHRRLMRHGRLEPHHVGAYRDVLGWVGGPSPAVAAHVAAPPELIHPDMQDLLDFLARDDVDPVTQAGIVHAQFETIHPFADGNGRIGRVLVNWVLARRLDLSVPPPVSLEMARDIGGYLAGLTRFRHGDLDGWIGWFSGAVAAAAEGATHVLGLVADLQEHWRSDLADLRADASARLLVEQLPAHPVLSAPSAATLAGVSRPAARAALLQLADRGIVEEVEAATTTPGRPRRWWAATDLLELVRA